MIKASIVGATGYTGVELVRLLLNHPEVEIAALTTQSYEGESFTDIYPSLTGYLEKKCVNLDIADVAKESDVIFVALPHGHSVSIVTEAIKQGKKVIDLGADFRLNAVEEYEAWYKVKHTNPHLLKEAVYGLPEINREKIKNARIIANPGCYPTSSILGLAPALKNHLIDPHTIIIDAKSGVSGAGRKAVISSLYAEANDSFKAYGVASHRHTPEIEQELEKIAEEEFKISFTPHLVPMTRGILATIYGKLKQDISIEEIRGIYEEFYGEETFVHILPEGKLPVTKWVYGSNNCHINIVIDKRTQRLVILSAIDNLIKGASGQAIQNMNLLFGFQESLGLLFPGMCP